MKKKGISLITLIITIIVIIILAGVIIFSMANNNPTDKAKEGVFKQDVAVFKDELEMYKLGMLSTNTDSYNASLLEADKTSATYNGNSIEGVDNIAGIIPGMNKKKDYQDIFMVSKGILVYIGNDENERKWAEEVDVKEIDKSPVITMSNPSEKLRGIVNIGNQKIYMIWREIYGNGPQNIFIIVYKDIIMLLVAALGLVMQLNTQVHIVVF